MSKNFATFAFVNPFTLAADVAQTWSNLSQELRHITLRSYFQFALPCFTENERTKPFLRQAQSLFL
jgi:hypothetical protein